MGNGDVQAMRAEMARLSAQVMAFSEKYLARERHLIESGATDYDKRTDLLLKDYSGAAQVCATLATSLGTVILAEIEYRRFAQQPARWAR